MREPEKQWLTEVGRIGNISIWRDIGIAYTTMNLDPAASLSFLYGTLAGYS